MVDRGPVLATGDYLNVNDFLSSASDEYVARMQVDGNLVVYKGMQDVANAVWATGTAQGSGDYFATLERGGGLVLRHGTPQEPGAAYWESGTNAAGGGPYFLTMQDDGSLALYRGSLLWTVGTTQRGGRARGSEHRAPQYKLGKLPPKSETEA